MNEKRECEICKKSYRVYDEKRHMKTKKHLKAMNLNIVEEIDEDDDLKPSLLDALSNPKCDDDDDVSVKTTIVEFVAQPEPTKEEPVKKMMRARRRRLSIKSTG